MQLHPRAASVMLTIALLALPAFSAGPPVFDLDDFERLSFELRTRPLENRERQHFAARVHEGDAAAAAAYSDAIDRWLDRAAIERYVDSFLRFPNVGVVDADAEPFFHRLSRFDGVDGPVYYLPHTVAANAESPCPPELRERVQVWWQAEPIEICADSYRPEIVFDEIGYCSGEAEPLMRQPPRPDCGCGPALIGCLPPAGEDEALDRQVSQSVRDEWHGTAARIVAEDRPLDELVTTTRTWQSGLVEFLYLRRELLGELRDRQWTPAIEEELLRRIRAIDVHAAARWVERQGIYEGSGLWWTSMAPHALKIPVRGVAHHLLQRHLGSAFHAINVDAEAVLNAVGAENENLRTLSSVTASPMRTTPGCRGCHAPMDGVAGFLGELQGPMYGSHPTGIRSEGEFFVSGAGDHRGDGRGIAELAAMVVEQPEFETTSVRRALEEILARPVGSRDSELMVELTDEFRSNGHRWKPILKAVLMSEAFLERSRERAVEDPDPAPKELPAIVSAVMSENCSRCHDANHYLDFRRLPEPEDTRTWSAVLRMVRDSSMPPPSFGKTIEERFPLEPSRRREFVAAVQSLVGDASEKAAPPRRIDVHSWLTISSAVAQPGLDAQRIEELTSPLLERVVLRRASDRGYNPALQVAMERVSEELCREIAASRGGREHYGLPANSREAIEQTLLRLYDAMGQSPVSASRLSEAIALYEQFLLITDDVNEAWTATCSTCLTSPRVLFEPYKAGRAR